MYNMLCVRVGVRCLSSNLSGVEEDSSYFLCGGGRVWGFNYMFPVKVGDSIVHDHRTLWWYHQCVTNNSLL